MKLLDRTIRGHILFTFLCFLSTIVVVFLAEFLYSVRSSGGAFTMLELVEADETFRLMMLFLGLALLLELFVSICVVMAASRIRRQLRDLRQYAQNLSSQKLQQFEQDMATCKKRGAVRAGSLGICGDGVSNWLGLRYPALVPWNRVAWIYPKGHALFVWDQNGKLWRIGNRPRQELDDILAEAKQHTPHAVIPHSKKLEQLAKRDFTAFWEQQKHN